MRVLLAEEGRDFLESHSKRIAHPLFPSLSIIPPCFDGKLEMLGGAYSARQAQASQTRNRRVKLRLVHVIAIVVGETAATCERDRRVSCNVRCNNEREDA